MRIKGAIFVIAFALLFTSGCAERELSPEDLALIGSLQADLGSIEGAIQVAEGEDAALAGGLVKTLIAVRLEILRTNKALIEQRIHAIESGAPVKVAVQAASADPDRAAALHTELAAARLAAAAAKEDAAGYGGLVGAMKSSTAATRENTVAMLEQSYLAAKYGLITPSLDTVAARSSEPELSEPLKQPLKGPLTPAADGPLGLAKGLTVSEIEAMTGSSLSVVDASQNLYRSATAPKENAAFGQYALVISPVAGLCQIRALGKDIAVNRFGSQIRSAYEDLQSSLTAVYGTPAVIDSLLPGSLWKDSEDWMMALHKEERYLISEWESSEASPLPAGLQKILLGPRTTTSSKAYLLLQYIFDNDDECQREIEAGRRDSL